MSLTNDECEHLQGIFDMLNEKLGVLRDRERQFVSEQMQRYEEHGAEIRLSTKQWQWLNDLCERHSS